MKRYLVPFEKSQNKMRVVCTPDKPGNAIAPWPNEINDFYYDCVKIVGRGASKKVKIDRSLVEIKSTKLYKEGKRVPQIYPTRSCFILEGDQVRIKQIPYGSKPINFLGETPHSFTEADEPFVHWDGKETVIDWGAREQFFKDRTAREFKEELERQELESWNNSGFLTRIKKSVFKD